MFCKYFLIIYLFNCIYSSVSLSKLPSLLSLDKSNFNCSFKIRRFDSQTIDKNDWLNKYAHFFEKVVFKIYFVIKALKYTILHNNYLFLTNNNEIFNEIVGQVFEIYLIGYGNDEENKEHLYFEPYLKSIVR